MGSKITAQKLHLFINSFFQNFNKLDNDFFIVVLSFSLGFTAVIIIFFGVMVIFHADKAHTHKKVCDKCLTALTQHCFLDESSSQIEVSLYVCCKMWRVIDSLLACPCIFKVNFWFNYWVLSRFFFQTLWFKFSNFAAMLGAVKELTYHCIRISIFSFSAPCPKIFFFFFYHFLLKFKPLHRILV